MCRQGYFILKFFFFFFFWGGGGGRKQILQMCLVVFISFHHISKCEKSLQIRPDGESPTWLPE